MLGDLIGESTAHEIALKISETSYLPVRCNGIEQIRHGPGATLDSETSIIAFQEVQIERIELERVRKKRANEPKLQIWKPLTYQDVVS